MRSSKRLVTAIGYLVQYLFLAGPSNAPIRDVPSAGETLYHPLPLSPIVAQLVPPFVHQFAFAAVPQGCPCIGMQYADPSLAALGHPPSFSVGPLYPVCPSVEWTDGSASGCAPLHASSV